MSVAGLAYLQTATGRDLLTRAGEVDPGRASDVARLRREHPADAVHAALVVAQVQARAGRKFPGVRPFWGVPEALEQASSLAVARHKARRLWGALGEGALVLDLCCGLGGDTLGLAQTAPAGGQVVGWELSEMRAWCAQRNLQSAGEGRTSIVCGDVIQMAWDVAGERRMGFHVDPARRAGGQRKHGWQDLVPGPEWVERVIRELRDGAVKLGPGVDFADLPPGHLELISEDGTVVQAVLWTGGVAEGLGGTAKRTATLLRDGQVVWSGSGTAGGAGGLVAPRRWIYEVDAAVHRAGLAGEVAAGLGLRAVNADGGYVTGETRVKHPTLRGFEVLATRRNRRNIL